MISDTTGSIRLRLVSALLASTALIGIGPALAQSLPTGGRAVSGGVTIGTPANGALAITQSSQSAIVNWQGFSIGQGNRVDIAQPNSQAAILNRVTGATPSTIAGQLNANGQVYLVNPNGIAITRTGKVNAAGFVASTLDIGDDDFRAGRRQFRGSGASAKVTNAGAITIGRGGYAALIGGEVSNRGTITVPLGKVGLGSGERATLDLSGDGFLQVAAPTGAAGTKALVRSSGVISADGGSVILTAAAARGMARQAVNLSGTIEAKSVSGTNGSITLSGGDGTVAVSGRLDATSPMGGGGSVTVTGRDIALSRARVDVSGRTGGGTVRIGGGRQGAGPLTHAANTRIDADTTIRADATRTGNGGDVVVWSDVATRFAGTISAKGGAEGGNGGQAEVSSKGVLGYDGLAILTAAKGSFGTLLLDPYNVTISDGADTGGFTAGAPDSVINAATLSTQLGVSSVTISTGAGGNQDGNITVAAPVMWTGTTLTLNAANALAINAPITVGGAGGVSLFYNTASPTNLSFHNGASIDYGAIDHGGTLSINNQSYALVYSMADLAGINTAGGSRSALATSLFATSDGTANGTPTAYTSAVIARGGSYSGAFEGLGHTIGNLTINSATTGDPVGLFRYVTGTVRDIGLVGGSITGGDQSFVGALVGYLGQSSSPSSVVNSYSTATVTGGDAARVGGLVGQVQSSGSTVLIANSYSTGNVTTGTQTGQITVAGGLVGYQSASSGNVTISGSHATGKVTGGSSAYLGGLVAYNNSSSGQTAAIVDSYATGSVAPSTSGVAAAAVGGLVGTNTTGAGVSSISRSFATGAVSLGSGNPGGNAAGGLVGYNSGTGNTGVASIADSYATGAVTGAMGSANGGLVGLNQTISGGTASIGTSYATGRVTTSGYGGTGGLVGSDQRIAGGSTAITDSYWDVTTSGIPTARIGSDPNGLSANVTGLTTTQFQSGTLPTHFSSAVWGKGTGLYPYLTSIFATAPQVVSGYAYADAGLTGLGSVTVGVVANGSTFTSASTGANGYYYAFAPAGTAANGVPLLAAGGSAATLSTVTNPTLQTGLNLYGNALTVPTSATTLSTAPTLADAKTTATAAAGGNATAITAIDNAAGRGFIASGAGFEIDRTIGGSNTIFVRTTAANAGITVSDVIVLGGGGSNSSLGLLASGALAINQPISVQGSSSVNLGYDASAPENLSFAIRSSVGYGPTNQGGSLTINGNPYALIYDVPGLQNINSGLTGRYALARDLDASGVSGFVPLGADGTAVTNGSNVLNGGNGFTGAFTGLGHTIDALSVAQPNAQYVGLFGYVGAGGLVQNVGVTNADTHGFRTLGAIAGYNAGTVTQSYSTGQLFTTQHGSESGGLIGQNAGLLSNSFSTVTVNARDTNAGGGAVGSNDYGTIDRVYAMGAVDIGSGGSSAGGLVGSNYGTSIISGSNGRVTNSFATGAASGGVNIGSFIGNNLSDNPVSGAYDGTTGRAYGTSQSGSPAIGGGTTSGGSVSVVGLSTSSFQNGGANGLSAAYGGGAGGLYPYLKSFYPTGVQAISGTAYSDAGVTPLTSGVGQPYYVPNPGLVSAAAGGVDLGTVSTGANGYYYLALPKGTLANNTSVVSYTQADPIISANASASGARNAATIATYNGGATLANVDVFGGAITQATSATSVGAAPSLADARTAANTAAGNVAKANTTIDAAGGLGFITSGASFDVDSVSGLDTLYVRTGASAPITVSNAVSLAKTGGGLGLFSGDAITVNAPITVNGPAQISPPYAIIRNALGLNATTTLAINAPINLNGVVTASLAAGFDTTTAPGVSLLNLSFGPGAALSFNKDDGTVASSSQGGAIAVNGQTYRLLYAMGDLGSVNSDLGGRYALATNLDATGASYTTAVIAGGIPYSNPAFSGTLTGLGHAISNLSIVNPFDPVGGATNSRAVGLIGFNTGTIRDLRLDGGSVATTAVGNSTGALVGYNVGGVIANVSSSAAVSGDVRADYTGGLVGFSDGSSRSVAIVGSSSTGAVSIGSGNAGGLVGLQQGRNGNTATIANSFATGAVSATYGNYAGGLVGVSQAVDGGTAAIANSYATGNVSIGGQNSVAGGLVGQNQAVRGGAVASLTNVYATGVVSVAGPQATAGALIGDNATYDQGTTPASTTPIVNAYWDLTTSGRSNAIGSDNASQAGNILGLTTRQLQGLDPVNGNVFSVTTNLGTVTTSAFASGAGGLYPYLASFFPTGVQVISGTAYADAGLTPSTPRTIGVIGGGTPFASASSGANGYYYAFGAAGTIAGGATLLAHNGVNAATLTSKDGATIQSVNLYGNALTIDTTATFLSTALSLADAKVTALAAAGSDSAARTATTNASGQGFIASGASFEINQAVSGANTFYVRTTAANAGITASQPITIGSGGSLGLLASGALTVNAPVTAQGAAGVNLAYDASSPTNLSFGLTGSGFTGGLTYQSSTGGALTSGAGGTLAINGQNHALLYTMGDVATINGNVAGNYAVATDIDATGVGGFAPIAGDGVYYTGAFNGLGHTISNLTIQKSSGSVGLFGWVGVGGSVANIGLVGGAVTGGEAAYVGALVAYNKGAIAQSYTTDAVSGGYSAIVGGLVGYNNLQGSITQSYATGAVNVGANGNVGGLVGYTTSGSVSNAYATGSVTGGDNAVAGGLASFSGGTIVNAYATGAVSAGGSNGIAAGLVGQNNGGIVNAYATGAVSANGLVGGLVASNNGGFLNAYWDTQTSGQANGVGVNYNNQSGTVAGLTTAQLQGIDAIQSVGRTFSVTTDLGDTVNTAFAGGFDGNYPYLASFFPNGVQVISGYAYADAGLTPAAPRTIGVIGGGAPFASASSGANGYYYAFGAPSSIATGASLLAHNGVNAATLTTKDGATIQSVNLYNGALAASTGEIRLSAADTVTSAAAITAANGNAAALLALSGATGRYYTATGASFTIDRDVTTSNVFAVSTAANAPLTVSKPITIDNGGSLGLLSGGTLAINAPVTVNGAGSVDLAYDASSSTNLSFAQGAPLTFTNADSSAATSAVTGQALAINGQSYTLLHSMSDVANVNTLGLAGNYALATNIGASGNSYTTGVIAGGDASGATPTAFSGVLEGLGHTVSNLTVSGLADGNNYIGLIGYSTGTVRDIGVVGGSVAGRNYVGALVGQNAGAIVNAYATSAVRGDFIAGGLAGYNFGTITQAYAIGAVRGNYAVGGLVGGNANGTISQSYATGAVSGPDTVGGLVGINNNGTITQAYATGAVSGSSNVGGLVGDNVTGTFAQAYWDAQTSGQANGIGTVTNNQSGNVAGLTTRQLQGLDPINGFPFSVVNALGDGATSAFAGGANGLYPYLSGFFPKGVQAVSGAVYNDAAGTPLASNAGGAVTVNVVGGGSTLGSATTGANGYYYAFGRPGAIANGAPLLAYINANAPAGAKDSVTLATASGAPVNGNSSLQTGVSLYNGAFLAPTSELTLSAAAPAVGASLNAALTDNPAALPAAVGVFAKPGGSYYYAATGASFTIDTPVATSNIFAVSTVAGAPLTVASEITLNAGGSLGLLSGGALAIDAAVKVKGAGSVSLAYDASSPTNLGFGLTGGGFTGSLTFAEADGSAATASRGGALTINGQSYGLLYNLGGVGASDAIEDINALGLSGRYALATNVSGAGTPFTSALVGPGKAFTGAFEGLGQTVTGLTIASSGSGASLGLFGRNGGTIRDIGIVGGSVTGTGDYQSVGLLVGDNSSQSGAPTIANVYATGTARAIGVTDIVGGLVASNAGSITNAFAGVTVSIAAPSGQLETAGGLVGQNRGTIANAYATGAVSISGFGSAGGLVGSNGGSITNAYAMGAVSGGDASAVGGLIGENAIDEIAATVSNVYATGAVSGATTGGLVGRNDVFGGGALTLANAAWDMSTSGQATAFGADSTSQTALGSATSLLQTGGVATLGFDAAVWGGATGGLYPYLKSFFPNGAQAVSGFAYKDGGVTPLASGANGAAYVSIASDGRTLGSVTTGANGYYYAVAPTGTLASGAGVAAYTQADATTGAKDAVSYVSGTPGAVTSLDISGGWRRDATLLSSLTTLDAGFATTTTGTPAAGFTPPNRSIFAVNDFALDAPLAVTGTLGLASPGAVTQTRALSADALLLEGGANTTFTLANAANQISRLAASGGAISVFSASDVTVAANVASACDCVSAGVSATGAVRIATAGDLTVAAGASVRGDAPVLAAGGAFINNAGAKAVAATSGRWLVYSADPAGDTFGGLDSGNTAVWNTAAGGAITRSGDRYVFAAARTLTVTSLSDAKIYGEDITGRVATDYAITGFDPGVAGAYLADIATTAYAGAASVTSSGAAGAAAVTGSPYAIKASLGSLTSASGYGFSFADAAALTVNRRALTVTADAKSRIYGEANPALTYAIVESGLINGDALSGGLTTVADATSNIGAYAITQGTLGNANYAISYAGANLGVAARALTITADSKSRTYGEANPALTYRVGGLGLVNGDALTGGLATSANAASNVGAYAITQGGLAASGNYAVTYAGANLGVTTRALTITADAKSRIYGEANPALTYAVGGLGLVNGDALTGGLATSANAASNVGAYAITQGTLGNANYAISYAGANLGVTARALTITADSKSRIYGEANPALTYAVGGLGLVNGDALTGGLATSANAASNVGAYAITQGGLAASGNYAVTYAGANLGVTARALTITADSKSRIYGEANPALTYAVGGLGLANGDALTGGLATSANAASNVGAYAITQGGLAASGNYAVTYAGANLGVTARALTITADSKSRIYGEANPALTYAVGGLGLVNGDALTGGLATSANAASNVGAYAITQGTLGNANYAISYAGANLGVTARALTITADSKSRIYGEANPALTYAVGGLGLVNGDALTGGLATSANAASNVGAYAITQGGLAASGNYAVTYAGANLGVTARALTITADSKSRIYGEANPALTYAVGGLGLANGDALTGGLATSANAASNVGAYAITQGGLAASGNYAVTYAGANLGVTARALTITADSKSRIYGEANPALTYAVGGLGLANGDALTGGLATSANAASNVGAYAITQGTLGNANYTISYAGANLGVTARALTITADSKSRIYGEANPALTYAVGGLGLVNGDALTGGLATSANAASNVGAYAITQGGLAASGNYAVTYAGSDLTVGRRALTITADAKSRIYGEANPALTYAVGGLGLVNGDALTGGLATSANAASNVGAYAITQGGLAASGNYAVTYAGSDLTVGRRALTITADAKSRIYGEANPALTYAVGGLGLANGDALTGGLATSATAASEAGPYAITQGGLAASGDYTLTYHGALLTVTRAPGVVAVPTIAAARLASTVARSLGETGFLPFDADGLPVPGLNAPPAVDAPALGFVGLADPRFQDIVVCTGGATGTCFPAPAPSAPKPQAAR